ncbi:bacteriophage abortive infection AbiH family protein [Levilactobacillus brevis]|uniref:bacteriophage abortive infection AbiH family protein n=1 Tax=Levilactobacillus brevis TaxID=1580 RepID=UPI001118B82E|nr:bacteriophage abortive infection AbiH family protein [Levilactobacillus brevis]
MEEGLKENMQPIKRLIIVGNGFDLDHELNTEYSGFKKYLLNNQYRDAFSLIPSPSYDHHGEEYFDNDELKCFLFREIQGGYDDEWKNFEERLGYLDFSENLVSLSELGNTDGNEWHDAEDNEDNMNNAFRAFSHLTDYFMEWLNDVIYEYNADTSSWKTKPNFSRLLNTNTNILNFNYTKTVENLYKFNNVNHIHGTLSDEDIILGHSHNNQSTIEQFLGADDTIIELEQSLYKDTNKIICNNIDFFDNLYDVEEVYTYGFSFSDVDMPYVAEIINKISSNATWFLHSSPYEIANKENYVQKLKNKDFTGTIKEWL